jgi:hypothetical protein
MQPQEAVDAMVKLLFAKWYNEQATIDLVKKRRCDPMCSAISRGKQT